MTTISVITPTFRREDLLRRCVESVLAQRVDADIQHFVINDAGEPLTPAPWMDDPRVTVLNTYRTERAFARNTEETLPPQASWVRREFFFQVGGFDPLMVPVEDVDLFRRIGQIGTVARTDFVVAVARVNHPATTTTDSDRQRRQWLRSQDQCLSHPDTLPQRATREAPYWRGRCARVYLGSSWRSLRQTQHGLAWGRLLARLRMSRLPSAQRREFWKGFRRQAAGSG